MRRIPLFLLFAATLGAALPAAAQTTPRRPPADTLRFGATRPAAGDSIQMADYDAEDADESAAVARADGEDASAEEDSVPRRPRSGPYARAGGNGPFSVQASGETAPRPPRGQVVWLEGRLAPRDTTSARRDTARAGGQRVATGQTARRDTASTAPRPAARDTAGARRNGSTTTASTTGGRQGQSSASTGTTGGRTGSTSTTTSSTSGRTGSTSTTTPSTSGRTGSTGSTGSSSARARSHTVAAGETFYGIARRYGVTAAQLRAVNPDVEMDALEVGDVLRLPASARDSRAGSTSTTTQGRTGSQAAPRTGAQGSASSRSRSHTVAAGETLFGIARRYGVTVAAIREANDMEGDQVRTGQRLVIPPAR